MKRILILLIIFFVFLNIEAFSAVVNGCINSTAPNTATRLYYTQTGSGTNPETYTAAFWTVYASSSNCTNNIDQYVLRSNISLRTTPSGGSCRFSFGSGYVTGTRVTFDTGNIATCPLDDYLFFLILPLAGLTSLKLREKFSN